MPAGQTRLQIINAVLPRLREATVATSSSTIYAALIASLLVTVKTQIEQAWQWRALRDTFDITVLPNVTTYSLTSSGQFAQIIDVWNRTTNVEVELGTMRGFNAKFFGVTTVATGNVTQYSPTGLDTNFDIQIDTWPNVVSTNALKANLYIPQTPDPTDSTAIIIPNQVLIEGILAYVLAERGDDQGFTAQAQLDLYRTMLSDTIAGEVRQDESETNWDADVPE
jgi:hypothetical protein